jgi:hypothetical protein
VIGCNQRFKKSHELLKVTHKVPEQPATMRNAENVTQVQKVVHSSLLSDSMNVCRESRDQLVVATHSSCTIAALVFLV